ncbi:MAG: phenylalanine--tRNA ligase subunit alpha [Candidatus Aenigmarchaeota archaeon]|nr:phenylalanine--tRNA ligase subunit alpha [Candidatus Aenigmarchaeota archaeon]
MSDYRLTEEGRKYLAIGLPEMRLAKIFSEGPVSFQDAQKNVEGFGIAIQWAKAKGMVEVREGKIFPAGAGKFPEMEILRKVADGRPLSDDEARVLVERKLAEKVSHEVEALEKRVRGGYIVQITPEMIKTGVWKQAKGFAPYDKSIRQQPRAMFQGKLHPYRQLINSLRDKMVGMGFEEARGPYVESEFWNFDALFMPQDHPGRGTHDALSVKSDSDSKILDQGLWDRVKATHEFGWTTGSRGWGKWRAEVARKLVMKSQNTAVSAREMASRRSEGAPYKVFAIDRVFRHDVVDAKHLTDFDQCEGIIVGENLNFRHLLGYLREIGKMFGAEDVRFKPSYFPFTEPSLEIYANIPGLGWVESGGAGIMRPEVTAPLGVELPVLAFGMGVGRLAMIRMGSSDIRDIYSENVQWLRDKSMVE